MGEPSGVPCADLLLQDGDELEIGQHRIQAISTPGHTDACTTFKVNGMLFTGDTLFIRSCGRTDFQQGNPKQLFESISQKLYCFPDETRYFLGMIIKEDLLQPSEKKSVLIREFIQNKLRKSLSES